MRSPRHFSLAAATVLTVVTALIVGAGSAASADQGPDLSSSQAIESYLVSIGVDPAEAVWQKGLRNYAGPSCPGPDWNCVPANAPIVQIAAPLGTNLFSCAGPDCVVVQVVLNGGNNRADCDWGDKHADTAVQVCEITQTNEGNPNSSNTAGINQSIQQSKGPEQDARQVARITQENEVGKNIAHIDQVIGQAQNATGGDDITQSQEAHQAATLEQLTVTGDNTSNIDQRQNQSQRASGAATITQTQNTEVGTGFTTCDRPEDATFDQQKNQCVEVLQNSSLIPATGGTNRSNLDQDITESQRASNADNVDQDQGNICHCLGQQGTVDQFSSAPVDSVATQDTVQIQTATGVPESGLSQFKDTGDPRCCQVQADNLDNTADIVQTTDQMASSPDAIQEALLVGECSTTGSCSVLQSATVNGETETNDSCTDSNFCSEVFVCESAGEGEGTFCFEDDFDE